MTWVAAGVTVGGAILGAVGQNKAAKAQKKAGQQAIDEQRRQFDLARQDQKPWLEAGQGALGRLTAASNGDISAFQQSPGYLFNLQQGIQGRDRSAASRGGLYSGGQQADLMKFSQGLASNEYGNWWNQQLGLANGGQGTAQNLGGLGMAMANNNSRLLQGIGDARASSYQNWGNTLSGIGGLVAGAYTNRAQPQTSSLGSMAGFGNNQGWANSGWGTNSYTGGWG